MRGQIVVVVVVVGKGSAPCCHNFQAMGSLLESLRTGLHHGP